MSPEALKAGRGPTSCAIGPERAGARSPGGPLLASALLFVATAPAIRDHALWLSAKPEILLGFLSAEAPMLAGLLTTGLLALGASLVVKLTDARSQGHPK